MEYFQDIFPSVLDNIGWFYLEIDRKKKQRRYGNQKYYMCGLIIPHPIYAMHFQRAYLGCCKQGKLFKNPIQKRHKCGNSS